MKKILIIVGFTVFLTSCLVDKKIIGKDELSKWS